MAARNAYTGGQRQEMRKAIKELREALRAQRDMLEEAERGGGVKVWACGSGDTPQFLTRRKKPLFENNQMIGRGWVWGAYDTGTLSRMTVLLTVLF